MPLRRAVVPLAVASPLVAVESVRPVLVGGALRRFVLRLLCSCAWDAETGRRSLQKGWSFARRGAATGALRLSAQVYAFVRRSNDSADDEGEDELVALLSLHRNVQCVHADATRRAALAACTVLWCIQRRL